MTIQPTDEQLKAALLQGNDAATSNYFFQHIRPYIQRTILSRGGTESDANAFFMAALVHLAEWWRTGRSTGDASVYSCLEQLTLAHYQSWKLERQQAETPETVATESDNTTPSDYESLQRPFESVVLPQDEPTEPADTTPSSDYESLQRPFESVVLPQDMPTEAESAPTTPADVDAPAEPTPIAGTLNLPSDAELKAVRRKIFTWKNILRLDTPDQGHVWPLGAATTSLMEYEAQQRLAALLQSTQLPPWANAALNDRTGFDTWQRLQPLDDLNSSRAVAAPTPESKRSGAVAFYIFAFLLLSLIGFSIWSFLNRPKPAPDVFNEHFNKPKSIMADLEQRYAADSSGVERPAACHELLTMADRAYTEGQLETAYNHLVDLVNEQDLVNCHSDAYYFMGIIHIERNEPYEAIEMFSRIDNIEVYGEDLYWYQSMAFVKMAQTDGESRDIARRSIERFLETTVKPERKAEAEEMLKQLQD
jgi:hypothetical protein